MFLKKSMLAVAALWVIFGSASFAQAATFEIEGHGKSEITYFKREGNYEGRTLTIQTREYSVDVIFGGCMPFPFVPSFIYDFQREGDRARAEQAEADIKDGWSLFGLNCKVAPGGRSNRFECDDVEHVPLNEPTDPMEVCRSGGSCN